MISVDVTLLMHIVNMVVLMFVLNAILYKPVLGILEKRAQKIESLNGDVTQFEQNHLHNSSRIYPNLFKFSERIRYSLKTVE